MAMWGFGMLIHRMNIECKKQIPLSSLPSVERHLQKSSKRTEEPRLISAQVSNLSDRLLSWNSKIKNRYVLL